MIASIARSIFPFKRQAVACIMGGIRFCGSAFG
jgi:hypothetical protein